MNVFESELCGRVKSSCSYWQRIVVAVIPRVYSGETVITMTIFNNSKLAPRFEAWQNFDTKIELYPSVSFEWMPYMEEIKNFIRYNYANRAKWNAIVSADRVFYDVMLCDEPIERTKTQAQSWLESVESIEVQGANVLRDLMQAEADAYAEDVNA